MFMKGLIMADIEMDVVHLQENIERLDREILELEKTDLKGHRAWEELKEEHEELSYDHSTLKRFVVETAQELQSLMRASVDREQELRGMLEKHGIGL